MTKTKKITIIEKDYLTDLNIIKETIRTNQNKKKFGDFVKIKENKIKEPDKVVKEKEIINGNTDVSKFSYNIKINITNNSLNKRKINIYLYILFNLLFGDTSSFDYEMKKRKIITNTVSYNLLDTDTHLIISLLNETDNYEELSKEIDKNLKDIKIDNRDFERKKKVLISNEIFSYENIVLVNEMIIDNMIFEGKIEENITDILKSLNMEEFEELINSLNFDNKSIVILSKANNNSGEYLQK